MAHPGKLASGADGGRFRGEVGEVGLERGNLGGPPDQPDGAVVVLEERGIVAMADLGTHRLRPRPAEFGTAREGQVGRSDGSRAGMDQGPTAVQEVDLGRPEPPLPFGDLIEALRLCLEPGAVLQGERHAEVLPVDEVPGAPNLDLPPDEAATAEAGVVPVLVGETPVRHLGRPGEVVPAVRAADDVGIADPAVLDMEGPAVTFEALADLPGRVGGRSRGGHGEEREDRGEKTQQG